LSHVVFHEQARAAGGRFCAARRIVATLTGCWDNQPNALVRVQASCRNGCSMSRPRR
jgi:hypothetical protein